MADPSTLVDLVKEPLAQLGLLGVIFGYVLYTDWITRNDNRKMEAARIARDIKNQEDAQKREDECNKRIQDIQNRHSQQLLGVIVRNNLLVETLLRKEGVSIPKTPTEGLDV